MRSSTTATAGRATSARLRALRLTACGLLGAAALAGDAALAGAVCELCERPCCDSGSLPHSASPVTGLPSLCVIDGRLRTALADAGGQCDFEDMYLIRIDEPTNFSATTVLPPFDPMDPYPPLLNTQLWLFDACGLGVLANDDDPAGGTLFSRIVPKSDDGSGVKLVEPGLYFLAITGFNDDPLSAGGLIFDQPVPTEVSGPDGPGGSQPIVAWTADFQGTGQGTGGAYRIELTGATSIDAALCPGDVDSSGIVDGADVGLLLGAWGPCPEPNLCLEDVNGDGIVDAADLGLLLAAWGQCPLLSQLACGMPEAGSCFEPHAGASCADACCCEQVCAQDPACCDLAWDSSCAAAAVQLCADPPCAPCPAAGISECEPCGADVNGGCNSEIPAFGVVECGDTICGTLWAVGGTRDTDWFEFTVEVPTEITFSVTAQLPPVIGLVATGGVPDCELAMSIDPFAFGFACETHAFTTCVQPGTWWLFVSVNAFNGFPCQAVGNRYTVTMECGPACTPPPNDDCEDAMPISLGTIPFSTVGATTDGPPLLPFCEGPGGLELVNDVWYVFQSPKAGLLEVSTCGMASFNTRLVATELDCFGPVLACSDDEPGCPGLTSRMVFFALPNVPYVIRLGGVTSSGSGELSLQYIKGD